LDPTALSVDSITAQSAAMTQSSFGMGVERKVLALAQVEGADLANLMASAGGVGRNISTYA
jgi:hypothetical protein